MRWVSIICMLALIASVLAHSGHDHHDHDHDHDHGHDHSHGAAATNVVDLTEANFDSIVSAAPLALVEFFAPWCGHCKELAPHYKKASLELEGTANLFAVDCTVQNKLCERFGVKGFPTLKVFRGDLSSPASYDGGRTAPDIVKYMKKLNQPSYIHLSNADAVNSFLTSNPEPRIVAVISENDEELKNKFAAFATKHSNDFAFAYVTDASLLSGLTEVTASGVSISSPSIAVFKNEDIPNIPSVVVTSSFESDDLAAFLMAESFPIIGTVGPDNFKYYIARDLPLVWTFYDPEDASYPDQLQEIARAVYPFRTTLSAVKLDGKQWAEHSRHFGIPDGQLPAIAIEDRKEVKKYVYSGAFNEAELTAFFAEFQNGALKPTLKSQEPPEDNSGPVTVVVGKTYDEIVLNNDKDVFVEFYAPWCGHCKQLAPHYEELGKLFSTNDNVVIAKVDGTENDTPMRIQGFPHLAFFPAGQKSNPINYEGDRTPQAMAEWIAQHGNTFKTTSDSAESHSHTEL